MSSSPTDTLVDVTMPQMGVSVVEGTVVQWHKQPGDALSVDETVVEISTDKIDTDVPASVAGHLAEILVAEGETVAVGTVLGRIETGKRGGSAPLDTSAAEIPAPPSGPVAHTTNGSGGHRHYSPVVTRIAERHGINLSQVHGTGRGGRVRKQDVMALVEGDGDAPLHSESPYREDQVDPVAAADAGGEAEPLSRMRRSIGEHMLRSLRTAAHCTTIVEADMSRIEDARRALATSYLPLIARAAVETLREFPALNATLEDDKLTRHRDVNLGIAVSLGDDGLIVPVVSGAQELSAEGLAQRIGELAARARAGELIPDDVRGGTFTITNPGAFGAVAATPIINQPQVAILDLEAVVRRPVVVADGDGNEAIAIRPVANLCMSWDHRALDGALAARFLSALRQRIENWTEGLS